VNPPPAFGLLSRRAGYGGAGSVSALLRAVVSVDGGGDPCS